VYFTAGGNDCFFWTQPIMNRFQGCSRNFFWEQPMQQVTNKLFLGCFHMEHRSPPAVFVERPIYYLWDNVCILSVDNSKYFLQRQFTGWRKLYLRDFLQSLLYVICGVLLQRIVKITCRPTCRKSLQIICRVKLQKSPKVSPKIICGGAPKIIT
jgi:hypothetical protein